MARAVGLAAVCAAALFALVLLAAERSTAIPVRVATDATDLPYDPNLANIMTTFSASAYCPPAQLQAWNCPSCVSNPLIKDFSVSAVITDAVLGTQVYVGTLDAIQGILVVFRGSSNIQNWIDDFYFFQTDFAYPGCPSTCRVHRGFYDSYNSTVTKGLLTELAKLKTSHPTYTTYVTGHSLGAAQAVFAAIQLAVDYGHNVVMYNMGEPRVGNKAFSQYFGIHVPNTYRIVHYNDIVPHLPPQFNHTVEEFHHICTEYFQDQNDANVRKCDSSCEDPTCMDSIPATHYSAEAHTVYLTIPMEC
ncbi:lipase [Capsaspora owczarzaki ATCC 30864]|uniref:Lipase n=1 Tax=Capsaspora owczarzaki (strain ATCC 30864) TaxID=595528 RepID=A0A0D2WXY2_CAPO3|nr:lipase [Capsaspora owczarzaki ATCC 30864]KJE98200.1 lipase [Capsaspora owczarzaki ATCC 30864]|eukprot:XP_004342453.1 lipase [Capsaspora owczarzaki ATCC 30864]